MAGKPHKVPKKYTPKKPPLRKRKITAEQARALLKKGRQVPRGTEVAWIRPMPQATLSRIKVIFLPSGEVKIPRYAETAGGLRVQRYEKVKDAPAAVRMAWHQVVGIGSEMEKIDRVYVQIQGLHEALKLEWAGFNAKQKEAATDYAVALAGSLEAKKGKLTEPHKIKTIERLNTAARLLGQGNRDAALASLVGSANDLVARKNVLLRQKPLLERRGVTIAREKFIEDKQLYEQLDRVIAVDASLTGPEPITAANREPLIRSLIGVAKTLGRRKDSRMKQCAVLARGAARAIREDKVGGRGGAIPQVKRMRKIIVDVASESTVLHSERLQWLARHPDAELKKSVVRNQLNFFAGNVEYWLSKKPTADQVSNMHTYILNLANALAGARMDYVQTKIRASAGSFEAGKIRQCKQQIKEVLDIKGF